ncbi:putative glycolipid-binding domain-containing protein [Microbispora sp. NPDC046933]|uniref:putative glycolipid-binding domain-containing protein n=1 Tax=Microbispora sp. NPDC046933 TaxID=3155618 RepID=UPI0033E50BBA
MPHRTPPRRTPPVTAAWQHRGSRDGFEVAYFRSLPDGYRLDGRVTAVENGHTWAVDYTITVDTAWTTRSAEITGRSTAGTRHVLLGADGAGHWRVGGEAAPHLDGCLDVDLEASALTNALPVRRLALGVGGRAAAPAAYVRALDLTVERLEQHYVRIADESSHQRYRYDAPAFDFECVLAYDEFGLVLDYPGIAVRRA